MNRTSIVALLVFLLWGPGLSAQDDRSKSLDFIILLDRSLSMDTKIEGVKTFFQREILQKQVKNGDSVLIIGFYGKAEVLIDQTIASPRDITEITRVLGRVRADGRWTDIGSAIDFASAYVAQNPRSGARQHFILLTDGIQEAPPESPYAGPKGYISHGFLENAKTIARSDWKIQILGLGSETEAQALAKELGGTAQVWGDTEEMLQDENVNFFESLQVDAPAEVTLEDGKPVLRLTVEASRLEKARTLKVQSLVFRTAKGDIPLLEGEYQQVIKSDGSVEILIPLSSPAYGKIQGQSGELVFEFGGDIALSPSRIDAEVPAAAPEFSWLPWIWVLAGLAFCGICFIIYKVIRSHKGRDREGSGVSKKL